MPEDGRDDLRETIEAIQESLRKRSAILKILHINVIGACNNRFQRLFQFLLNYGVAEYFFRLTLKLISFINNNTNLRQARWSRSWQRFKTSRDFRNWTTSLFGLKLILLTNR